MAGRPLIGVTVSARGSWWSWWANRLALGRAGARAVRVSAVDPFPVERLDGLVVGGGDDIDANLYGHAVNPASKPTVKLDPERDRLELAALDRAEQCGLPVLGICRGAQMINVHRGGSLHGDIHDIYTDAPRLRTPLPRKRIWIVPDSRLYRVLGLGECRVNALHHQSVDRLGAALRVVARDRHGIVQAVEAVDRCCVIGVQWHPEYLVIDDRQQNLFRTLVAAASGQPMDRLAA